MSIDLTMPRLSDTMEKGTIIKWNVREGDEVSAGEAVADIETDKATMEMQVYDDGRMASILVGEGETVDVGALIAVIAEEDEDLKEVAESARERAGDGAPAAAEEGGGEHEQRTADRKDRPRRAESPPAQDLDQPVRPAADGRIRTSPVARRMAEEHDIDLGTLEGSGPGGRIVKRDVLRAVEARQETAAAVAPSARPPTPAPAPALARTGPHAAAPAETPGMIESGIVPLSNMRQTIARRLVESNTQIPHYQVTMSFDVESLLELRATLNDQLDPQGVKLSVNDFLVRACALAIHRHPEFNASWGGDHLEVHGDVNVGIAIDVPPERGGGLVVATIRHADRKSLRAISQESKHLAEKARTRGLTIEEMSDSTFTISNLGMFGVEHFTAIINPPNSAILAVGAAMEKPVVRDGALAIGHEMSATLSLDHRIIDGATAARFMQTLEELIRNPATLLV